jgi:hypothetical protein
MDEKYFLYRIIFFALAEKQEKKDFDKIFLERFILKIGLRYIYNNYFIKLFYIYK